jgi:hypothetical protein
VAVTHTTRDPASRAIAIRPPDRYASSSGWAQIPRIVPSSATLDADRITTDLPDEDAQTEHPGSIWRVLSGASMHRCPAMPDPIHF